MLSRLFVSLSLFSVIACGAQQHTEERGDSSLDLATNIDALDSGTLDSGIDAEIDSSVDVMSLELPPIDEDISSSLKPCLLSSPNGERSFCTQYDAPRKGVVHIAFDCPRTSRWEIMLASDTRFANIEVRGVEQGRYHDRSMRSMLSRLHFTSLEFGGGCEALIQLPKAAHIEVEVREIEDALTTPECDKTCIDDKAAGTKRGCNCERICHDPCRAAGYDCGLKCNTENPEYACPFYEEEIRARHDCELYPDDTNAFEHRGACYRCGDGQQCCYTSGRDNGSGSFDLCPPLDPGPDDRDPHGCSGVIDHCSCDVIPLCGCMAESGAMDLCRKCIGTGTTDIFSCNAPGDDDTFCERAAQAAKQGFQWCTRITDVNRCFDRPVNF